MSDIQAAKDVLLYVSAEAPGDITAVTDPTDTDYALLEEQIGHSSQASTQTERARNKSGSKVIGDGIVEETVTINTHLSRSTQAAQEVMIDALENGTEVTILEYPDGLSLKGKYYTALVTGKSETSTNGSPETRDFTVQIQTRPTSFTTAAS